MTDQRDRREQGLARLFKICDSGIDGIDRAYRNKQEIGETDRPCIRTFDGSEGLSENVTPGEHRSGGGHIMSMLPTVGVALSGPPENIGSQLNALRVKLIKAVTTDAELLSICGKNGRIRYLGCSPEFASGRAVEGEMFMQFMIAYPLIPAEL